jgi:hypothetical protein
LLVRLKSPRRVSWRVSIGLTGADTRLMPPWSGVFGSGKNFRMASPAGLSMLCGMMSPGKQALKSPPGVPGSSHPPVMKGLRGRGPVRGPLKLPMRSAAVGTLNRSGGTSPRRSLRHSSFQKKKARLVPFQVALPGPSPKRGRTMGPLKLKPKLL